MLDIRDGGFTPWAGVLAAILVAFWQGWRREALRRPLLLGPAGRRIGLGRGSRSASVMARLFRVLRRCRSRRCKATPRAWPGWHAASPWSSICGLPGAAPAPIKAPEAHGVEVTSTFEAPGGLTGYTAIVRQQVVAI